ncbi:MAG: putative porin, partial [Ferruginibacter sp.]
MKRFLALLLFSVSMFKSFGQDDRVIDRVKGLDRNVGSQRSDTIGFEHRDDRKDSITISFRYLDSTNRQYIDSSVSDFDKYFSVPSSYQYLGNNGAPAFPLIFEPFMKAGWDPGFHVYDIYRFTLENSKFYKTTRPFSILSYQLASGKEQMIKALHTQNPRPNLNVGFDF